MLPAIAAWPPKIFTPNRFDSDSLPFLELPTPFLCAIILRFYIIILWSIAIKLYLRLIRPAISSTHPTYLQQPIWLVLAKYRLRDYHVHQRLFQQFSQEWILPILQKLKYLQHLKSLQFLVQYLQPF